MSEPNALSASESAAARKPGRPRASEVTEALKLAAARTMATEGYSKLSVDSLAGEVGTTRPTFYRRFSTIAHLVFEVVTDQFNDGPEVDTGTLRGDLLALQRQDIAMFASPLISNSLAGLLEAVRTDPTVREIYREGFILPRRKNVARVLGLAVERGEIDAGKADADLVSDLLVGPIMSRVLLPTDVRPDDRLARDTVEVVYRHLTWS